MPNIRIASNDLPHPTNFAYRYAQPILRSGNSRPGMLFANKRDSQLRPGVIVMTWQGVSRSVCEAVFLHFSENDAEFDWTDNIENVARKLSWLAGPSVQWISPTSANVIGEFELSLAHA